jgi:hypothetical protein
LTTHFGRVTVSCSDHLSRELCGIDSEARIGVVFANRKELLAVMTKNPAISCVCWRASGDTATKPPELRQFVPMRCRRLWAGARRYTTIEVNHGESKDDIRGRNRG